MRMLAVTSLAVIIIAIRASLCHAQSPLVDETCAPIELCLPARQCSAAPAQRDNRDCAKCLAEKPLLGGCLIRGNDPFCEAQKAAQNSVYEAQRITAKSDCEALKEKEADSCKTRVNAAIAECKLQKGGTPGNALLAFYERNKDDAGNRIPQTASTTLVSEGLYSQQDIENVQFTILKTSQDRPSVFENSGNGFTIGDQIFLANDVNTASLPLRFWITQLEFARLYSEYGIEEFSEAFLSSPPAFFSLVDRAVERKCGQLHESSIDCD